MQPDGSQGGRRPGAMPIPGARASLDDPRWQVLVTSASLTDTASVDLDASLQDGIFGTSLRRHATDHGYGSLGHGHGAWLSSSPHPTSLRGFLGPLPPQQGTPMFNRTPSLQYQVRWQQQQLSLQYSM